MINVEIKRSEDLQSFILSVKGHAGSAEEGHDLVCASASILAYTVAQCVSDMHKAGGLRKKPNVRLDKGDAEVVFKPKKAYTDEAMNLLWVAENGFALLAHNFPDNLTLKAL